MYYVQAEGTEEADAGAEQAEDAPEADKEEWQQIDVPLEWQPRPMFKVLLPPGFKTCT